MAVFHMTNILARLLVLLRLRHGLGMLLGELAEGQVMGEGRVAGDAEKGGMSLWRRTHEGGGW